MRLSRIALMSALGVMLSGTSAGVVGSVPRSHSKYSIPEFTPTKVDKKPNKVDKKPNKVSQKKRRMNAHRKGHK
ncbi:hypothetical protein ACPC5Q_03645 [Acinetobacter junii]|uniref:hypothetical protein n=1 Tax=Acinetobacter junii TaxID=40215 RepID=UPI003C1553A6